jgi:hypothetical protein
MNLVCPCCQAVFPIEAALNDLAGRQAIVEAFKLTPFGDLLLGYVKLFTPPKRALSNMRMVKLLEELLPMIREGKIERGGRIWSAPQDYWRMALAEMINKRDTGTLTLPLKTHGYMLAIIEGYSNKAEAKQEAHTEARRGGSTPVGGVAMPSADQVPASQSNKPRSQMPAHVKQAIRKGGNTDGNP